jgi:hypothetical protein
MSLSATVSVGNTAFIPPLSQRSDNNSPVTTGAVFADDILDLSPEALDALGGSIPLAFAAGGRLTLPQQQQVAAILTQFANAPLSSQTLDGIRTALSGAGIDSQQVSVQELLLAFNARSLASSTDGRLTNHPLASDLVVA